MDLTREHFRAMVFYFFRSIWGAGVYLQPVISAFGDKVP